MATFPDALRAEEQKQMEIQESSSLSEPTELSPIVAEELTTEQAEEIAEAGFRNLLKDGFSEPFANSYKQRTIRRLTKPVSW